MNFGEKKQQHKHLTYMNLVNHKMLSDFTKLKIMEVYCEDLTLI